MLLIRFEFILGLYFGSIENLIVVKLKKKKLLELLLRKKILNIEVLNYLCFVRYCFGIKVGYIFIIKYYVIFV